MAASLPDKSQKLQLPPAITKLNLIALKPLVKTDETQPSSPPPVEPPLPLEPTTSVEPTVPPTKNNSSLTIDQELQDFEFKLSGLWQFIPVCQSPCITVQKNFSEERLPAEHRSRLESGY